MPIVCGVTQWGIKGTLRTVWLGEGQKSELDVVVRQRGSKVRVQSY